MTYFKKYIPGILILVMIDQAIKLLIQQLFRDNNFSIIGNLLRFKPVQNTNLSWGGNYIPALSNFWITVLLNFAILFIFISGYLFYLSKSVKPGKCAEWIFISGMSGALCSLIDKLFWGGSLDFIQIPGLFTFDLKDCYISVAMVLFVALALKHNKDVSVNEYFKWLTKKRKLK